MKLLIVCAGPKEMRAARLGLDKSGWAVHGLTAGTPAWREPELLAEAIVEENPDVLYSPTLFGGGRRLLAAFELASGARRPWLTSVSAFDFMTDYQEPAVAEQVHKALLVAEALLPFSGRHLAAAREAGFVGTIFPATRPFPELDLELVPRHGLGSPARGGIVVDGAHGLTDRGLVAIAAIRWASDHIAGREVIVINADRDAAIAATVAGTDTGARVRVLSRADSTPRAVLDAHSAAVCSVSLSLEPDVRWTEIAAMAEGALPIVSRGSAIARDLGDEVVCERVDPEDPKEVAEAIARVLTASALRRSDRARNASLVRDWFDSTNPAAALGSAVTQMGAIA